MVKKSIVLWKLGKLAIALTIMYTVTYFSLKGRIEREHGPGSWDEWLKAAPEVEQGEVKTAQTAQPSRPKNLKARFWTGVPRSRDGSTVRLDRHGYSAGYSKGMKTSLWFASYLTGKTLPPSEKKQIFRKWEDDPELGGGALPAETSLRASFARGHFIDPKLMAQSYGWDADTWLRSNGFQAPEEFSAKVWPSAAKLVEKYAKVYGGLVCFVIPVRHPGSGDLEEIAVVMVRPSPKGPTALGFSVPTSMRGEISGIGDLGKNVSEIEEKSGVYLFADLPPEWREFLLHTSQAPPWPLGG